MDRYVYSLVRCVPEPRTGEFINLAAIVGCPETGDWSSRQVGNEARVRKLADAVAIEAAHGFLARVGMAIDSQQSFSDTQGDPLTEAWLYQLHHDHRNVVQLSEPAPIIAEDAENALDVIFAHMIIDPVSQARSFVSKSRVMAGLRDAYQRAHIEDRLVRQRVEVFVGNHVHSSVDFAIANGHAVQLTQAWSFQKAGVDEVALQVKAWGYALRLLRDGDEARVVDADGNVSTVSSDVDVEVVVASPTNKTQEVVYEEAQQVFSGVGAKVHNLEQVDDVGARAADLLHKAAN